MRVSEKMAETARFVPTIGQSSQRPRQPELAWPPRMWVIEPPDSHIPTTENVMRQGFTLIELMIVIAIIGGLIYLGVKIFVMVWAFKDATARGDQNAVLWPILIFFTSIIGLVIYLAVRPKGDLSPCASCHKQRLSTLSKCPHCSLVSAAPPPAPPPAKHA